MTNTHRLTELTLKYVAQEITTEELTELNAYLDSAPGLRQRFEDRISEENVREGIALMHEAAQLRPAGEQFFGWTDQTIHEATPPVRRLSRVWYWAAAAVLAILITTGVLFIPRKQVQLSTVQAPLAPVNDHAPGGNRALLTLDGGQQVVLDSVATGVIAQQQNSQVKKTADGEVSYAAAGKVTGINFNTLSTPAGGQYRLVLSDGTKVWLNNATQLRFPSAFTGAQRDVSLVGEAYFEVASDKTHPFIVHKGGMTVRVLGTHFNIRAYNNESLQSTTLLEGSVQVTDGQHSTLLKPGDRAGIRATGGIKLEHGVNVDEVISWKNGYFHFDGEDLPEVMMQLARWYDVSVEYRGTMKPQKFKGRIERNLPLSTVLQGLEGTDVHFSIEGKKIVVKP